ncbi:hypothetical protein FRIG_05095 [Frigoribacterium faeni]|uniref:hypothetical protein n=1 Tax=Frigoribacterium faeni TaxID=145483 RepID=UPI001FAD05CF|nr:hypothetical protein [Frigoribacterium faeni]MCJ0700510.1 hypothetical protein [Frigoribacterium faeni]
MSRVWFEESGSEPAAAGAPAATAAAATASAEAAATASAEACLLYTSDAADDGGLG